jgi:hypothetical protein
MPVFSSKMTLFGKAGLYTIIGMVSGGIPLQYQNHQIGYSHEKGNRAQNGFRGGET